MALNSYALETGSKTAIPARQHDIQILIGDFIHRKIPRPRFERLTIRVFLSAACMA